MTFVFERLLGATAILSILYLSLSIYAVMKLVWLQATSSPGLNTRKLFVMTCLLTSILRFMSFGSMAILDLQRVNFSVASGGTIHDDDSKGENEVFFEKSSIVLFDLPDFCIISSYILLIVVWAEAFLKVILLIKQINF
jgi:hypothetical protein